MAQIERNETDLSEDHSELRDIGQMTEASIKTSSDHILVEFLETLVSTNNLQHPLIRAATLELIRRNDERRDLLLQKFSHTEP